MIGKEIPIRQSNKSRKNKYWQHYKNQTQFDIDTTTKKTKYKSTHTSAGIIWLDNKTMIECLKFQIG